MANSNANAAVVVPENSSLSPTKRGLKHNIKLSVYWSPKEQALLEKLLVEHASDKPIMRYTKIAVKMQDKTVRDVALRYRWMLTKQRQKRKVGTHMIDDSNSSRKHKGKREKHADQLVSPSSDAANGGNDCPYAESLSSMDSNDDISCIAIDGPVRQILEQNNQAMNQIDANFSAFEANSNLLEVQKNINLVFQIRNNFLAVSNVLDDMPGTSKPMPAMPVKIDDELVNSILNLSLFY